MSKDPKHLHYNCYCIYTEVDLIIRDILHMDRVIRLLFSLHMDCYSPFPIYLQDSRQKDELMQLYDIIICFSFDKIFDASDNMDPPLASKPPFDRNRKGIRYQKRRASVIRY